ncbi:hypothetical protein ACHAPT_002625 [Fusarium lateritium]
MHSLRTIVAGAALALAGVASATHIEFPPCLDPFQPFVYSGCYTDGVEGTSAGALIYRSSQNQYNMTVEKCVAECKGNGFRYAGLKYWGVCYCGSTVSGAQLTEDQCDLPCSGNSSQTCGGDSELSVWQDPTFKVTSILGGALKVIADYAPLGCYTDNSPKGRALTWGMSMDGSTMTVTKCLNACSDQGFPLAGIEYGGECYCGNVLANDTAKADILDCSMPCNGDILFKCGGPSRLSVFVSTDLQSLQPCGWKPPSNPQSSSSALPSVVSTVSSSSVVSSSVVSSSSSSSSSAAASSSSSSNGGSTTTTTSTTSTSTSSSSSSSSSAAASSTRASSTTTLSTSTSTTAPAQSSTNPPRVTTTSSSSSCTTLGPMCTATVVVPNDCEYKVGGWCAPSVPDFQDQDSCQNAYNTCAKNIASCFQKASWPNSLDCFNFSKWCDGVQGFCASTCSRGRSCNKSGCLKQNQPVGGNPVKTTTSVFPCAATSASSSVPPASSTSVAPQPTNICQQPSSRSYGYGPGNPVAGIELPLVGCNDLKGDFTQKPFKLYTDDDSRSCKSYQRNQQSNACADACKTQYDQCNSVYVQSCKKLNGGNNYKRGHSHLHRRALEKSGIEPRWFNIFGNDGWQSAQTKCYVQYQDCLDENASVNAAARCQKWGTGA